MQRKETAGIPAEGRIFGPSFCACGLASDVASEAKLDGIAMNDDKPIPEVPLLQIANWERFSQPFANVTDVEDSASLLNILEAHDGAAVYGIWSLLLDLCRRQTDPRGWLTEDGKRDGVRYTLEKLASLFHRPQEEVLRMVQVMSADGVKWLRFVEGDFTDLLQLFESRDREKWA